MHKFDYEHIYSGLSVALGHEQFGLELTAERLGPNGVSNFNMVNNQNTSLYMRIEALSEQKGSHLYEILAFLGPYGFFLSCMLVVTVSSITSPIFVPGRTFPL